LISTGSEVYLTADAAKQLKEQGIKARVVSAPCLEIFDAQDQEYRLSVLPDGAPIMSIEAYSTSGWNKYAHESFGLVGYGASGPADQVYKHFELTVSHNGRLSVAHTPLLNSVHLDSFYSPRV
jgi:transketolase